MSYKISIANEKGGVAKTTSTISLGAILAEKGRKTLVIDLDPQANLTLALGLEPSKVQKSSASLLLEGYPIKQIIKSTAFAGLDFIPSNSAMGLAERIMPSRTGYENILRKALEEISNQYDFILFDCPPFLGAVTLNALVATNLLVIPTQAEFFSIYALRNIMSLVRRVRTQYNAGLTYRLLLTMVDRRNRTHRSMSDQLRTSFNAGVLQSVIEIDTKLRESSIAGEPIIYHAPKTRASLQYRALAQEILEYVQETTEQPA
jgi:chromosome partitioning protein